MNFLDVVLYECNRLTILATALTEHISPLSFTLFEC